MANGDTNENGNTRFLKWLVGILLTIVIMLSGFLGGRISVSSDISENRMGIQKHTVQIEEIQKGITEIKQGQNDLSNKFDRYYMMKRE